MDFLSKYTADILENLELVLLCFIGFQFAGKFIKVVVTLIAVVALGLLVFTYVNGGTLYTYQELDLEYLMGQLKQLEELDLSGLEFLNKQENGRVMEEYHKILFYYAVKFKKSFRGEKFPGPGAGRNWKPVFPRNHPGAFTQ